MDQEKIGKFIKQIRKDHHLTQVQLAQKYGVTYQAVSKWENGKNIPDIVLLKQMSKDFQVNIEDILDGQVSSSKKQSKISSSWVIIFLLFVVILLTALLFSNRGQIKILNSRLCRVLVINL